MAYTTVEAAEELKVSKETIRRLIKAGTLKAFRVGHNIRIDESALEEFKKENEVKYG